MDDVGISRRGVGRPPGTILGAACRVCRRRALSAAILRALRILPLLALKLPLLILVLLILVLPLLGLVLPRRILVLALLIPISPLALLTVHARLWLRVARPRLRRLARGAALAGSPDDGQTEEQDRHGDRRRMPSFRVGGPVHESRSRQAAEMSESQSPVSLLERDSI